MYLLYLHLWTDHVRVFTCYFEISCQNMSISHSRSTNCSGVCEIYTR
jgi:hypothetical protein